MLAKRLAPPALAGWDPSALCGAILLAPVTLAGGALEKAPGWTALSGPHWWRQPVPARWNGRFRWDGPSPYARKLDAPEDEKREK